MLLKVEAIEYVKKNPLQSSHKIAQVFNCGCTQIESILTKNKF